MDKHNFRYLVVAVNSNDDNEDVSHVAIRLHPSAVLRLAWKARLGLFVWQIAQAFGITSTESIPCYGHLTWLNWWKAHDDDAPEQWDNGALVDQIEPGLISNESGYLVGQYAELGGAWVSFSCFHKHGGMDFTSNDVLLCDLLKAIRWSDVLAELRTWATSLFVLASPAEDRQSV